MLNWRDPLNPQAGGAERVTEGYLSALADRGHQVFWYANEFSGSKRQEPLGKLTLVRGGGAGRSVLAARAWAATQPPFDLVIDQHHGIPWYTPWWSRTRRVSYIHEVLGPIWNAFYSWPLSLVGRMQERWTHWLYRHEQFWTACESTRDQLLRHGIRSVKIIRYGVHTRALDSLPPKLLAEPLRLIAVSRLAPNKRVDHILRAVAELRSRGLDCHLTVIGGGEQEANLKRLAAELGLRDKARFTGRLPEPEKDRLLGESHWLLHASQREGWGLNVIEANALGTPAAVYPVEGLRESTLDNETGILAKAETPQALADRLEGALRDNDSYQNFRIKAWQRAATMHWDCILPQACDWLEAMARGGRGA